MIRAGLDVSLSFYRLFFMFTGDTPITTFPPLPTGLLNAFLGIVIFVSQNMHLRFPDRASIICDTPVLFHVVRVLTRPICLTQRYQGTDS